MRKGVTPVIAIVLLLMMTVAAAGMAYVFIQQVQTDAQTSTTETLAQTSSDLSASIEIVSIWSNTDTATYFVIRNSGRYVYDNTATTGEVEQFQYYYNGALIPAGDITQSCQTDPAGAFGAPGTTCEVHLSVANYPFPTALGSEFLLRVVPPVGKEAQYRCLLKEASQGFC